MQGNVFCYCAHDNKSFYILHLNYRPDIPHILCLPLLLPFYLTADNVRPLLAV